ncbi:MAG: hypothetical protein SGCHY_005620 [Lobulomycetales sp.]
MGIKTLNKIAKRLRSQRMERGALVLASPEVKFSVENDTDDPVDVEMKQLKETNALVEEFMLLANISVARRIHQVFPESSLLRRHPQPPASNFDGLKRACAEYGVSLNVATSKQLADSLDAAIYEPEPYFNQLVRIMTTRCMMQAVYFCSGTIQMPEFWHYGLACDIYTHFTSPIRRYADLIVHRLLAASIGYDENYSAELTDKSKLSELSTVLNYRHRQAQQASRSSVELYTNIFFRGKERLVEDGFVIRLLKNGISVLIPRYGLESIVHFPRGTEVELDESAGTLTAGQAVLKLFGKVRVGICIETAGQGAQRSKLVLDLVEPAVSFS